MDAIFVPLLLCGQVGQESVKDIGNNVAKYALEHCAAYFTRTILLPRQT